MAKLKINPTFDDLLRDHSEQEYKELKASIKADGLREPIVIWRDTVIDGHHRYRACQELKIEPTVKVKTFDSEDDVIWWILRTQLARRNLTPTEYKVILGRIYNGRKKDHGGERENAGRKAKGADKQGTKSSGQPDHLERTADEIAKETGSSPKTVRRGAKLANVIDTLDKSAQTVIKNFPEECSEAAILSLGKMDTKEQKKAAKLVQSGETLTDAVKKVTPAVKEVSPAKLVDDLLSKTGQIVRGIDAVSEVNGGKGEHHKGANACLNNLIGHLKKMREGKK